MTELTEAEARTLTARIRESIDTTWRLLAEAHARKAWVPLKYCNFSEYVEAEFGIRKTQGYRLVEHASVVAALEGASDSPMGESLVERETRGLKPRVPSMTAEIHERIAAEDNPDMDRRREIVREVVTRHRGEQEAEKWVGGMLTTDEREQVLAVARGRLDDARADGTAARGFMHAVRLVSRLAREGVWVDVANEIPADELNRWLTDDVEPLLAALQALNLQSRRAHLRSVQ